MSEPTPTLTTFFTLGHRHCDEMWAEVESAVQAGQTGTANERLTAFVAEMERHLRLEEDVMFPAFEHATGMTNGGPTFVMRSEHEQMRGLMQQMGAAADDGDFEDVVDLGDTLLILIQQHNQKEEHMLYPMAERALSDDWSGVHARLVDR